MGKIGVPEAILLKPGQLTEAEREKIRGHVELGEQILTGIPGFEHIVAMVSDHHERWDGRGYPRQKAGESIDLGGRILAVADAYDAMTSQRVYREPIGREEALAELLSCSEAQFDPAVVQAFVRLFGDAPGFAVIAPVSNLQTGAAVNPVDSEFLSSRRTLALAPKLDRLAKKSAG